MTDVQAKKAGLLALRRRITTAQETAERHLDENWHDYGLMPFHRAVAQVETWLDSKGFGPKGPHLRESVAGEVGAAFVKHLV